MTIRVNNDAIYSDVEVIEQAFQAARGYVPERETIRAWIADDFTLEQMFALAGHAGPFIVRRRIDLPEAHLGARDVA